jgi:hypothetical protein
MTEPQAALDRIITEILHQAGGDADRACAIAERRWDCGPQMMKEVYRMIRTAAAAAAAPAAAMH